MDENKTMQSRRTGDVSTREECCRWGGGWNNGVEELGMYQGGKNLEGGVVGGIME